MAYPKMKPCPNCKDADNLNVFNYDGWRHVECVKCNYLGPGCTSFAHAIRHYNAEQGNRAATAAEVSDVTNHGCKRDLHPEYATNPDGTKSGYKSDLHPGNVPAGDEA